MWSLVVSGWLHGLSPSLRHSYQHNSFMFDDANGTHVLLLGEKDMPASPFICTAELSQLSSKDEIEEVFLCYSLSYALSNFNANAFLSSPVPHATFSSLSSKLSPTMSMDEAHAMLSKMNSQAEK